MLGIATHLYGLHHEGYNVGVLLQLGLQRLQVIVGDDLEAWHEGPKAAKALRICRAQAEMVESTIQIRETDVHDGVVAAANSP